MTPLPVIIAGRYLSPEFARSFMQRYALEAVLVAGFRASVHLILRIRRRPKVRPPIIRAIQILMFGFIRRPCACHVQEREALTEITPAVDRYSEISSYRVYAAGHGSSLSATHSA